MNDTNSRHFILRRSKKAIIASFAIVEPVLIAILFFLIYMWIDTKGNAVLHESVNFPFAFFTLALIAVFFHCALLMGLCYKLIADDDKIEIHRFLRPTKAFCFSDIKELRDVTIRKGHLVGGYGVRDFALISQEGKRLGYIKSNDRNYGLFVRRFKATR
ncbi:MAG: hypothetical protein LBU47_01780 [Christensenellaceae bacterium]|nr:hypothetical protein [Christensenellaceae bacterium]